MVTDNRRGMDQVLDVLDYWRKNSLRVGVMSNPDADSPGLSNNTPALDDDGDNAPVTIGEVFVFHELGLGNLPDSPPRSMLAATMDNKTAEIENIMEDVADAAMQGKITPKVALSLLGEEVIELIKQRITERIWPPLTEERRIQKIRGGKPGDTPLVNHGQLINSFNYEITRN